VNKNKKYPPIKEERLITCKKVNKYQPEAAQVDTLIPKSEIQ
jgi:hypothetical protein